jgi:hypothetical protein
MQAIGNAKARQIYEANLPDTFRRSQTDSAMEQFIRGKYEAKKWIAKEWTQPAITVSSDVSFFNCFKRLRFLGKLLEFIDRVVQLPFLK